MLVLITGLPGTGKSTVADHLAKRINAKVLRTDEIRKHLFTTPKYTNEEKEIVYNALFLTAENLLKAKQNVVVDGTFYKKALRQKVHKVAASAKSSFVIVECTAPDEAIARRMVRRLKRGGLSDADYEVYKKIKKQYEPIESEHIVLNTDRPLKETLDDLYSALPQE